jgi:glycosyltransferase involved in cell wall biosynthesis
MLSPAAHPQPGPLSIALVSTEQRWQGGEQQARLLAEGLRQLGHHCLIAAIHDGAFAERMRQEDFRVVGLAGRIAWPHRCWQLRRQLKRHRVDIVHFNDSRAITIGGLSAWGLGRTVTVASRRASFPIRSALRYNWLCDRVFCVSTHVAEICRQGGVDAGRLRVVHDGVDPHRMAAGDRERGRRKLGIADRAPLLLSVGTLATCKGHCYLIEAMPAVLRHFPDSQLVIAGQGDRADELRRLIAARQLQQHVRLLGFRDDVPDLVHACDLFVFPSIEEGLGSTLIDVMLAGRPIVATTAGGIPDVLGPSADHEGPVAWLTAPGDSRQLSEAICAGLRPDPVFAEFVQRGRQRAATRFTADHMVRQTVGYYQEALDQLRTARGKSIRRAG